VDPGWKRNGRAVNFEYDFRLLDTFKGTGQEYGGGRNWCVNESRQGRFTLEALHINRNPAQNFLYPYRAGYSGTAIQTQLVVAF
jgi:hypothetical protein